MTRRGGVLQPPVELETSRRRREVEVVIVYRPNPIARDRLADLLVELLDASTHSR